MAAVDGLALKELFDPKATVLTPIAGLCESAERGAQILRRSVDGDLTRPHLTGALVGPTCVRAPDAARKAVREPAEHHGASPLLYQSPYRGLRKRKLN